MDNKSTEKLKRAWFQILKQYQRKAETDAKENGPGMSIFSMEENDDMFNCSYYYVSYKNQTWEKYIGLSPQKDSLEKLYKPEKMFIISVNIPSYNNSDTLIGNIRLFEFDSYKEIILDN